MSERSTTRIGDSVGLRDIRRRLDGLLHDRRTFWVTASAMLVGVLAVLAFPVRNLYAQERELAATRAEIADLREQSDALEQRTDAINDPFQLELEARRDHHLVLPGEESYSVLPPPQAGEVPTWVSTGLAFDADEAQAAADAAVADEVDAAGAAGASTTATSAAGDVADGQ